MGARGEQMQADVLSVLQRSSRPLSAYGILAELRPERPKLAPQAIYRALGALCGKGQVHRLETKNTYVPSQTDRDGRSTVLSICDDCGTVSESAAPEVFDDLSVVAEQSGFVAKRHVVEIIGRCGDCTGSEHGA
ncbi:MAG: transcriptional repressor [Pseudomonadota bacterium]